MRMLVLIVAVAAIVLSQGQAFANAESSEQPTPETVIAFVDSMIAHIDAVGEEKAFADFTAPKGGWVKGELYGFCHTLGGSNVAHGGNTGLVGKNVLGFKDPDGVLVNAVLIDKVKAEDKGWVEYKWPNSMTKKIQTKHVYARKVKDKYVCGSGYYQ